jgi:hypothetical protein
MVPNFVPSPHYERAYSFEGLVYPATRYKPLEVVL